MGPARPHGGGGRRDQRRGPHRTARRSGGRASAPRRPTVTTRARREGNAVWLEVSDDDEPSAAAVQEPDEETNQLTAAIIGPSEEDKHAYRERDFQIREWEQELLLLAHLDAVTPDHQSMLLRANIDLPGEQAASRYQHISLRFKHFFTRKAMFAKVATAFIVLPGGIGAVAYNAVVAQRPGEPNTIVAFSGGSLLNIAQGRFGEIDVANHVLRHYGDDTPRATEVRHVARELETRTGFPGELVDERYTTAAARRAIREMGGRPEDRPGDVDALSATVLLQHALGRSR